MGSNHPGRRPDGSSRRESRVFSATWRTNSEEVSMNNAGDVLTGSNGRMLSGDASNGTSYNIDANISVHADEDILVLAAQGFDDTNPDITDEDRAEGGHAMIGHGGDENHGSFPWKHVTVISEGLADNDGDGGIVLRGGRYRRTFAQIGYGSSYQGNRRTIYDVGKSGNIEVIANNGPIRLLGYAELPGLVIPILARL